MNSESRLCPCCDEPLPLGLFSHAPRVVLPRPIIDMHNAGQPMEQCYAESVITVAGRWFIACEAKLPLDWDESPITVGAWVEVDRLIASRVIRVLGGELECCEGAGMLACDLPGFPGSMGARIAFRLDGPQERSRVLRCNDTRIKDMHGHGGHARLVKLYRRCWNNGVSAPNVAPAHKELRAYVANAWRELIARPTYRKLIEPPPRMAGIHPAELLIATPMDTGAELAAATLGNAEANPREAVELITFAANPGDEFLKSFSEFCYWSRGTASPLKRGHVITEKAIPETNGMTGWLLCDPWWLDWSEQEVDFATVRVELLAAVAVHPQEVKYARERGVHALLETMELSDVDATDLQRESVVV